MSFPIVDWWRARRAQKTERAKAWRLVQDRFVVPEGVVRDYIRALVLRGDTFEAQAEIDAQVQRAHELERALNQ